MKSPPRAKANDAEDDEPADSLALGAFIWCSTPDSAVAADLTRALREGESAGEYCAALPWEAPRTGSETTWRKARWTLSRLRVATYDGGPKGLQHFDELAAKAAQSAEFDPETARLLREMSSGKAANKSVDAATESLSDRLGRSGSDSCERLVIGNVHESAAASSGHVVRFAVRMAAASDFGAMAGYLCKVGCRLHVLPASVEDRRLRWCI